MEPRENGKSKRSKSKSERRGMRQRLEMPLLLERQQPGPSCAATNRTNRTPDDGKKKVKKRSKENVDPTCSSNKKICGGLPFYGFTVTHQEEHVTNKDDNIIADSEMKSDLQKCPNPSQTIQQDTSLNDDEDDDGIKKEEKEQPMDSFADAEIYDQEITGNQLIQIKPKNVVEWNHQTSPTFE